MSRRILRVLLAGIVIVSFGFILFSFGSSLVGGTTESLAAAEFEKPLSERDQIVPRSDGVTVITGQGFGGGNSLMAFGEEGRILYYENRRHKYFDVDPVPNTEMTVIVVSNEEPSASSCNSTVPCQRDTIERINLSTGERELLHTFVDTGGETHDADLIGPNRLLVAGLERNRVYVVNTSTGIIEWQWNVRTALPRSSGNGGAGWPTDWTHLNDVEQLPDGRYMVSLRNQDRVVFVDPAHGLDSSWTLGSEDDRDTLYEQHNPDFIPESRGGPAVLVADSHNNRVIEYQRTNGSWQESWVWEDERMAWPRDADRLPNGHTLIVDSNGGRVIEVNQSGSIVWQVEADSIYDAERLWTGDESAGGRSAESLGLNSRTVEDAGNCRVDCAFELAVNAVREVVPIKYRNAAAFVLPGWFGWPEVFALAAMLLAGGLWAVLEIYWRELRVGLQRPIVFK